MRCLGTSLFFELIMSITSKIASILDQVSVPNGFLATSNSSDNYRRVWARDSAILSIALIISDQSKYFDQIKKSIKSLQFYQSETGAIPSNIPENNNASQKPSFGSLVGRVDATTWWLIMAMNFIKKTSDTALKNEMKQAVYNALIVLECWEFNNRNLIYTPMGGNWADEYVISGYTLYDNLLRYWSLKLVAEVYEDEKTAEKAELVKAAILANFNPESPANHLTIHPRIHHDFRANSIVFWPMSFDPSGYQHTWDTAANALLLLLGFPSEKTVEAFVTITKNYGHHLVPAFYPVINESDNNWMLLKENYNYSFKNYPNHFHNGGSWPVMFGLLGMGFAHINEQRLTTLIFDEYLLKISENGGVNFSEYINPVTNQFGGMNDLCFSVAGYLFLETALTNPLALKKVF